MKEPKRYSCGNGEGMFEDDKNGHWVEYSEHKAIIEALTEQLRKQAVMCWVSVKDALPTKDGQYCTYLQNSKYDSIGFTQFLDGQFMSSFVTHWMEVVKPCT